MMYVYPLQATTVSADEPGDRIVAFLIKNGIPTADAFIAPCVNDRESVCVSVDANGDPGTLLANYVSTLTREERALTALKDVIRAIRTTPDLRTAAQRASDLEKGLLALAALVHFDTDY